MNNYKNELDKLEVKLRVFMKSVDNNHKKFALESIIECKRIIDDIANKVKNEVL